MLSPDATGEEGRGRRGERGKGEEQRAEREELREDSGDIELSDDEKIVFDLLKDNSPIELNVLKEQTGLSNKKWDKAIKGLTKNNLARVEKTEEGLVVSVAGN